MVGDVQLGACVSRQCLHRVIAAQDGDGRARDARSLIARSASSARRPSQRAARCSRGCWQSSAEALLVLWDKEMVLMLVILQMCLGLYSGPYEGVRLI